VYVIVGKHGQASVKSVDSEGNAISITATGLSTFGAYNSVTSLLNFDPISFASVGTYPITVSVADAYGANTYSFNVFVQNNPPIFASTITSLPSVHAPSTSTLTLPSSSDPDGHTLTVTLVEASLSTLPAFMVFTAPKTLSIQPTAQADVGTYSLTLKACDGQPLCVQQTFSLLVTNTAPAFVGPLPDLPI
jgi:hypothetical protein